MNNKLFLLIERLRAVMTLVGLDVQVDHFVALQIPCIVEFLEALIALVDRFVVGVEFQVELEGAEVFVFPEAQFALVFPAVRVDLNVIFLVLFPGLPPRHRTLSKPVFVVLQLGHVSEAFITVLASDGRF
jgi:hypothetical protein